MRCDFPILTEIACLELSPKEEGVITCSMKSGCPKSEIWSILSSKRTFFMLISCKLTAIVLITRSVPNSGTKMLTR